jgi:hypothetical protein
MAEDCERLWEQEGVDEFGFFVNLQRNGEHAGRPKTSAISDAARFFNVSTKSVYTARDLRNADIQLFDDVKAGRRTLNEATARLGEPKLRRL